MYLENLYISREKYGDLAGRITGHITTSGEHGQVKINLSHEHGQRLLEVVAEAMVETSREVAELLTTEIIEHTTPQLSHEE